MRTFVLGDIHGCYRALLTLEQGVGFRNSDQIICLGDYVDRGPQSKQVLDWIIERHARGTLFPLMGNHEEMMLQCEEDLNVLVSWLVYGGQATLCSFGFEGDMVSDALSRLPSKYLDFMKHSCQNLIEAEDYVFVHAGLEPNKDFEDQSTESVRWMRLHELEPHQSGKVVVCGHTPQRGGRPVHLGHAICLDTGAYHPEGWLTAWEINSGKYWQANQKGAFRGPFYLEPGGDQLPVQAHSAREKAMAAGVISPEAGEAHETDEDLEDAESEEDLLGQPPAV